MPAAATAEIVTNHAAFHLPLPEHGPSAFKVFLPTMWPCTACKRTHMVNPATGVVLGAPTSDRAVGSKRQAVQTAGLSAGRGSPIGVNIAKLPELLKR